MISSETNEFEIGQDRRQNAYEIMTEVMTALEEKGYNNGARGVIRRMERDELLEVILRDYVERL